MHDHMTSEQLICAGIALLITLIGCALLPVADTPRLTAMCAATMVLGLVAFCCSLEEG